MTALNNYLSTTKLTACLSMPFNYLIDLRRMFEVAQASAARNGIRQPSSSGYELPSLCLPRQMFNVLNPVDYRPEGLYRLIESDRETGRDDLKTLYAYIENGLNGNAAAKELHIHRNTLINRLERIQEILALPLDDRDVVLFLRLCFRILEMYQ